MAVCSMCVSRSKCYFSNLKRLSFAINKKGQLSLTHYRNPLIYGYRPFLSQSYKCNDQWTNRFQSPLLKNVSSEEMFFEIDRKFQTKKKVSAVDIDIYAHSVKSAEDLPELENILHRFRRTKATARTLESTHYAVVKAFVDLDNFPALLNILNDRIGYGIFPDHYGYNFIIDKFLEEENYRDATKVAILMMQQEDFSNPIGATLALYACHMYLQKPQPEPWEPLAVQSEAPPDDDEEVFVRIPYIRNPHFDDHFDIKNPMHLIGKTLFMVGKEHDDIVGRSYQLIGLGMHEKWEKSYEFLDRLVSSEEKSLILEEAVRKFQEMLEKTSNDEKEVTIKEKIKAKLEELIWKQGTESGSLNDLMSKKVESIKEHEAEDIEKQKELFGAWEKERQATLDQDLFELTKMEMKNVISAKRRELEEKEQELFFFENWDKHHMTLHEIAEAEAAMQKTDVDDENYIPPEVHQPKKT